MKRSSDWFRWVALLLAAAFVFGCSSNDNDDAGGDDGDGDIVLLPLYEFQLTSTADDPITVNLSGSGLLLQLGHLGEGPGLIGSYHIASGAFSVFSGSSLVIDELGAPPQSSGAIDVQLAEIPQLFGDFEVEATADWLVPAGSDPDTGALLVRRGDERVEVAVIDSGDTVRIRWDETGDGVFDAEASLTWTEFDDLDETAPEWQRLGDFAYSATIEFMLELAEFGLEGLSLIDEDLVQVGERILTCDAFSAAGLSVPPPPPVIPDAGSLTFAWFDDAADGEVGPGDSFSMQFDYCLDDDPTDDIDDLVNGTVGLNSYTEVVTERNTTNFVTRVGFEGTSPAARPGGLAFEALERWEVIDTDGSGPLTTTEAELNTVIDGRLVLVFFEPTD